MQRGRGVEGPNGAPSGKLEPTPLDETNECVCSSLGLSCFSKSPLPGPFLQQGTAGQAIQIIVRDRREETLPVELLMHNA